MKKKRHSHSQQSNLQLTHIFKGVISGLLVLLCIGLMVLLTQIFKIRHIECELNDGKPCPLELTEALGAFNGKPMFFTNYHKILSNEICLSQPYSLERYVKRLPTTIHLVFAQEKPLAVLNQSGSLHVISDTGKAFPQTEDSALPSQILQVETSQELINENVLDPDVLDVLSQIIEVLENNNLPIDKVTWLDKSTIQLSMKDRTEVAIIDSESPALQLQRLFLILQSKEYQEISEAKQELDVRFTMPVLRTAL